MKVLPMLCFFTLSFIAAPSFIMAQSSKDSVKTAAIKNLVQSGRYVFYAQTATSMRGDVHGLTPDFTLDISKEKIISDLPYYGQDYMPSDYPPKGGFDFTSSSFDYSITPRKRSGWDVTIKPKDYKDVQQMVLFVSAKGYANLQVISANRSAINFNGVVASPRL